MYIYKGILQKEAGFGFANYANSGKKEAAEVIRVEYLNRFAVELLILLERNFQQR